MRTLARGDSRIRTSVPASTMRVLFHAGHGVPMFRSDSTLLPAVVAWTVKVLR